MGKHHHKNSFLKGFGKAIRHNHTLRFLADPVKPIESIVHTAHKDGKQIVKYGGKHLIQDVDKLSSGFANSIPLLIGGAVVVLIMMNRNK